MDGAVGLSISALFSWPESRGTQRASREASYPGSKAPLNRLQNLAGLDRRAGAVGGDGGVSVSRTAPAATYRAASPRTIAAVGEEGSYGFRIVNTALAPSNPSTLTLLCIATISPGEPGDPLQPSTVISSRAPPVRSTELPPSIRYSGGTN